MTMKAKNRLQHYRPRLGDGLATVYQPPAIKRHRFHVSPLLLAAIMLGSALPLSVAAHWGMPLVLVVLSALAGGE
jgi:hypothetical protein